MIRVYIPLIEPLKEVMIRSKKDPRDNTIPLSKEIKRLRLVKSRFEKD